MSEEEAPRGSGGGSVAVTRGTSILSEMFDHPRYPQSEMLGIVGASGDEEATARDSDDEGTQRTEPLSDVEDDRADDEEEDEEDVALPALVDDSPGRVEKQAGRGNGSPTLGGDARANNSSNSSSAPTTDKSKLEQFLPLRTPQSAVTQVDSPLSEWASPASRDTVAAFSPGVSGPTPQQQQQANAAKSAAASFRFSSGPGKQGQSPSTVKVRRGMRPDLYELGGSFPVERQFHPLDAYGNTAMLLAARMDDVASLRAMFEEGWELPTKNYYGEGLLHNAVWGNNSACAALLPFAVQKGGLSVDERSLLQRTPLQHAALHGNTGMMAALLALGADIGAVDGSGQTALHLSVEQRKAQAVALLLERGSSPNAQDKQGNTPLHVCAMLNLPELAAALLSHGASNTVLNHDGDRPSDLAELYGHGMMSRFLECSSEAGGMDFKLEQEDEEEERRGQHEAGAEGKAGAVAKKLAVRLRVGGGQEMVFEDVELLELSGDHHLEAMIPPVA